MIKKDKYYDEKNLRLFNHLYDADHRDPGRVAGTAGQGIGP